MIAHVVGKTPTQQALHGAHPASCQASGTDNQIAVAAAAAAAAQLIAAHQHQATPCTAQGRPAALFPHLADP
jgi:hypothetical protein